MAPRLFSKHAESASNAAVGDNVERKENHRALGLRKCVQPVSEMEAVDIVFVHGLTGDREKTWTHQTTACFWPEALLPSDLPNARIFTYGYDADVAHFFSQASQSRIGDHAKTLLSDLARIRERTETTDMPLILVAHSLGGLVVEDMLVSSKNSAEEHHRQILESTRCIAFMGTPHCGSQLADWAKVGTSMTKIVKRLNENIISVLQPDSEVLARIQQEFHTMLRARNDESKPKIKIVCFYEDLDTTGIGAVVPKHSAILPAYNAISIPGNHYGMTKFADADDTGYQRVSGELWIWYRDITEDHAKAQASVNQTHVPSSSDHQMLLSGGNNQSSSPKQYYMGSMNHVGQVFQGTNNNTFQF